MKQILKLTLVLGLISGWAQAQSPENDFKVGYFLLGAKGVDPDKDGDDDAIRVAIGDQSKNCGEVITSKMYNGKRSSPLNQLKDDGVNIIGQYYNYWFSDKEQMSYIDLCASNGLQFHTSAPGGYIPDYHVGHYNATGERRPTGTGQVVFSNSTYLNPPFSGVVNNGCTSPFGNNQFINQPDKVFENVYINHSNSLSTVWGMQLAEEPNFAHNKFCVLDPPIINWTMIKDYMGETPPVYYKDWYDELKNAQDNLGTVPTNYKQVLFFSNHNRAITFNSIDRESGSNPALITVQDANGDEQNAVYETDPFGNIKLRMEDYNPHEFLTQFYGNTDDLFTVFEGSYARSDAGAGIGSYHSDYNRLDQGLTHQLGPYRTIDYCQNYTSHVHKMIATYLVDGIYQDNVDNPNPDPENPVNNFFLFNTNDYGSGYEGNANWLWFQAYNSIIHGAEGVWLYQMDWRDSELGPNGSGGYQGQFYGDDFSLSAFPWLYRTFGRFLIQELGYLNQKDLLNTVPESIVLTKKDENQTIDPNCILPPTTTYLTGDFTDPRYGIRYTIRTNGDESIMILSNPTPLTLNNISVDLSTVSDPVIQNANQANRLFNNQSITPPELYKTGRNSTINLAGSSSTVNLKDPIAFTNKQFNLNFGPYDVHVISFKKAPDADGWDKVWSNNGNGSIGDWEMDENDEFLFADYDGDGLDEMLVYNLDVGNNLMMVLDFNPTSEKWERIWTNYGTSHASLYGYKNDLIAGDFDGDGRSELLGNGHNGWITTFDFDFNGTDWDWSWSYSTGNCSQSTSPILDYDDELYALDYNGDGTDEIFGVSLGSPKKAALLSFDPLCACSGCWTSIWTNHSTHPIINYLGTKTVVVDLDADNDEEITFLGAWGTSFDYLAGNWNWMWSTSGASGIDGWSYPLSSNETVIAGDFDNNGDSREELMFIEKTPNGDKAGTFDLAWYTNPNRWEMEWNWPTNSSVPIERINDWPIATENTISNKYYSVKLETGNPDYLLCARTYSCVDKNKGILSIYKTNGNTSDYKKEPTLTEEPNNSPELAIYPNPSSGIFTIEGVKTDEVMVLSVYDASGRLVHSLSNLTSNRLDLNHLSAGVYNLQVIGNDFSANSKIVIKK